MPVAIKVENVSKAYQLGEFSSGTLSRDLERWWALFRGKEDPFLKVGETNDRAVKGNSDIVWSLKDLNFEIQQGDAVGIIGKNGAGKSTLLKVLSQVTSPTTGKIKVKGRIASLLEVGTGFHPELTGRENIFLNGAILGMRKHEISRQFDQIVDFSGVERYIDTPVKRYSSGMYVRLAFAVAAHLESEILIVDEVLAVGDSEFQKKCLGKMGEVSKGEGRTVLFVSHNMSSIRNLCSQGILLKHGSIDCSGATSDVINLYENTLSNWDKPFWINNLNEQFPAKLERIEVRDDNLELINEFKTSQTISLSFFVSVYESDIKAIKIGFDLIRGGDIVFRSQQIDSLDFDVIKSGVSYVFKCLLPKWTLNEGEFFIRPLFSIHCVQSLISDIDSVLKIKMKIDPSNSHYHQLLNEQNQPGSLFPILKWNYEVQESV